MSVVEGEDWPWRGEAGGRPAAACRPRWRPVRRGTSPASGGEGGGGLVDDWPEWLLMSEGSGPPWSGS